MIVFNCSLSVFVWHLLQVAFIFLLLFGFLHCLYIV